MQFFQFKMKSDHYFAWENEVCAETTTYIVSSSNLYKFMQTVRQ